MQGDSRNPLGILPAARTHHILHNKAYGSGLDSQASDGGCVNHVQKEMQEACKQDYQKLLLPEDCLAGQHLLCLPACRGAGAPVGSVWTASLRR